MASAPPTAFTLAEPTEAIAIRSLEELVGPEVAGTVWETTCDRANVVPPVWELPALLVVAELLTASDVSLARVAGRSMVIRIVSYRELNEKGLV
jgi:hypothetical protein